MRDRPKTTGWSSQHEQRCQRADKADNDVVDLASGGLQGFNPGDELVTLQRHLADGASQRPAGRGYVAE